MAQIETAELKGAALDWAVACSEYEGVVPENVFNNLTPPAFSTDRAQGGPIITREKIMIEAPDKEHPEWSGYLSDKDDMGIGYWDGPTLLIAAMRCYVASKLGDVVEVPDELTKQSA